MKQVLTLRQVRARPLRALLVAAVLAAVFAGAGWGGAQLWFIHHLRAARLASDRWHNTDAGRHLQQAARVRPDHPEVLILQSRVARRTGDPAAAGGLLDRYTERHGHDEPEALERLLLRASQGDLDDTAAALRAYSAEGGERARLVREAVVTGLMTQYRFGALRTVLADWLAETPDDPLALLLRGKYLEGSEGLDEAVAAYRRAVELDPELLDARLRLAHLLVARRMGTEALAEAQVLRARLPDNARVQVLTAKALALAGRPAEAAAELDDCLRRFPDEADALAERGTRALVAGDEEAAVTDLARAVALDPGHTAARSQYALALARCGRADDSKREYAVLKQFQDDMERGMELVRGPLQRTPNDPAVLHEIGAICARAGQVRDAERWFGKALAADPDHLLTHRALTALYRQTDNPILAARHRAIVKRLDPSEAAPAPPAPPRP